MTIVNLQAETASRLLAGALLRVFTGQDESALDLEITRNLQSPVDQSDTGEAERLELLSAVASRMRAWRAYPAARPGDPELELCMNLLAHLAIRS